MSDIAAFLEARYAEEERIALAAAGRDGLDWPVEYSDQHGISRERGEHIARHDPARALAQVAAGRARLAEHAAGRDPCDAHDPLTLASEPCQTLRIDAGVYAGHPDYKETWQ